MLMPAAPGTDIWSDMGAVAVNVERLARSTKVAKRVSDSPKEYIDEIQKYLFLVYFSVRNSSL